MEAATYGAEFLATRTCVEQIVDLRNKFRYLGVPVFEISYVFADNESQIKSSSIPYANKHHNILSYHYVRNQIAKGHICMNHIPSQFNVSDTLSKHWGHQLNYGNLIKPILNFHDYENPKIFDVSEFFSLMLDDDAFEVRVDTQEARQGE